MFKKILEKIKEYDTIIIHRHLRPDGDAIGSQMGLKYLLQESFPEKKIYAVGDEIPDYLSFIGSNDIVEDEKYQNALAIVVDTSVSSRICGDKYKLAKEIIKIDHHDDSDPFADIEYVDPKMAACAAIITSFYLELKDELIMSTASATALYTGIITDTGRFLYRGVDSKIMECASELLKHDVDNESINVHLNLKDGSTYRLQGYIYSHLKCTKTGIYYLVFTKRLMKKFNVTKEEAAALVNSISSIKGSLIWVTFVYYPDNIRVRLRSRFVPINDVAKKYRGGGHLLASGATIYNKKEMKELLNDLDIVHEKYKKDHPEAQ